MFIANAAAGAASDGAASTGWIALAIALIANTGIVLVALVNSRKSATRLDAKIDTVYATTRTAVSHAEAINDAVNHRHPGEPRLLDLVKITRDEVRDTRSGVGEVKAEVAITREGLAETDREVRRTRREIVDARREISRVDRDLTDHISWEEKQKYVQLDEVKKLIYEQSNPEPEAATS